MYGLKQAGLLANQLGIWLHKARQIAFTLVVDDFAVKFVGKDNAHHLRDYLLHHYEITTDWGGTVKSGMTLKWDYQKRTCDISIPGYVTNCLEQVPTRCTKTPTTHTIQV
jgi:hypothetical protein